MPNKIWGRKMSARIGKVIIWIIALFYAYGAVVHVMNMLSLTGFDWLNAPMKWQVLDIVYLFLDIVVAIGFFAGWKISYVAFYLAAISQIILYTLLRACLLYTSPSPRDG